MKTIGIKLADGSFYPILKEGTAKTYQLDLTTVKDGQTKVQIDLYRSESGTMEDAQYVDTLEVSNLVPHPNGEADLHLSVALNDKNELDAKVIDEETGRQSQTTVTLVSRTLAERADPVNFELSEEPKVMPEVPADDFFTEDFGAGIVAQDVPAVEDMSAVEETSTVEGGAPEETASSVEGTSLAETAYPVEGGAPEETASSVEGADFLDEDVPFSFDRELAEDETVSLSDPTLDEGTSLEEGTSSGEGASSAEETSLEEGTSTVNVADFLEGEPSTDEEPSLEETTSTVEEPSPAETTSTVEGETFSEEPLEEDGLTSDSFNSEDFKLPDFDDISTESQPSGEETVTEDSPAATEDSFDDLNSEDFELPDFGDIPEETQPQTEGLTGYFDDPDFKDDPVFNETNLDTTGSEFDTSDLDFPETAGSSPAMDFSDLYDKETLDGKTSVYDDEEETEKKTRVPVIICIVCAIICVIATLLILFVVPSKYNLIKNHKNPEDREQVSEVLTENPAEDTALAEEDSSLSIQIEESVEEAEQPAEEQPVPEAPQAVEDEIVIAPEPETVVPVPPAQKKEETKDVKYRIRWGDTLWDISDAYYKNPWRYHKIAKYNNIKNPDLIISGTDILIPVE